MSRCQNCPVPADVDCPSERYRVYCKWAEGGLAAHVNLIVSKSKTDWRSVDPQPIPQDNPAPITDIVINPREAAAIREVMVCLYRQCNDGCRGTHCHWTEQGARPRRVRLDDCLACMAAMKGDTA